MDMARLDKDMASDEVRLSLEESLKLAETLGLNGTPSYVIGEDVVVGAVGLDTAKIEKDLAGPEVRATIEENFKLAEAMGMNGTPSYVIGKQIVIGAIGLEGLKEKIGVARCGKATC